MYKVYIDIYIERELQRYLKLMFLSALESHSLMPGRKLIGEEEVNGKVTETDLR